MKGYIHARLGKRERAALEQLTKLTGQSESELVRRGLELVAKEVAQARSALELCGSSVGRFEDGPRDLATDAKHMEGFGE